MYLSSFSLQTDQGMLSLFFWSHFFYSFSFASHHPELYALKLLNNFAVQEVIIAHISHLEKKNRENAITQAKPLQRVVLGNEQTSLSLAF